MSLKFHPQEVPAEPVAGFGAVPAERLQPSALRMRFQESRIWTPDTRLDEQRLHEQAFLPAAVLIPVCETSAGPEVVLTRRSAQLRHHAGQISFPGGRYEDSDADLIATALRETREETGIAEHSVEVLGTLPLYRTGTGYEVTPVVGLLQSAADWAGDASEVTEIFTVPLHFLMDDAHHFLHRYVLTPEQVRHFYSMPYGEYFIWGATAGMLRNLYHFLRA